MRQSVQLDTRIPKGLSINRTALLTIALGEVGVREATGNNDGPVEKYMPAEQRGKGLPYCAWFTQWVFYQMFSAYPYGTNIGRVTNLMAAAKKRGETCSAVYAQPGDIFIVLHGDGTGHAGLVLRTSQDRALINTLEANWRNQVGIAMRLVPDLACVINPWGRLANEHESTPYVRELFNAPYAVKNAVASTR